jgi:hypothetical protein
MRTFLAFISFYLPLATKKRNTRTQSRHGESSQSIKTTINIQSESKIARSGSGEKYSSMEAKTAGLLPHASDLEFNNNESTPVHTINPAIPRKTYWQKLTIATTSNGSFKSFAWHAYQPAAILFTIPAVFYMSLVWSWWSDAIVVNSHGRHPVIQNNTPTIQFRLCTNQPNEYPSIHQDND